MKPIPFVQAKWYHPSTPMERTPRVIVIHSMESQEKPDTAENVAQWFKRGPKDANGNDIKTSAHYCIDSDSIVQCVQCRDVAFGAKGFNRVGIHLELAGRANQTREQWIDAYSLPMLRNAAELIALVLCPKFHIDRRYLSDIAIRQIAAGKMPDLTGVCTHRDITRALSVSGGHTDPGPNFPRQRFLWEVDQAWILGKPATFDPDAGV